MNAYTYNAALYCPTCAGVIIRETLDLPGIDRENPDQWPQGPIPNGGGEADTPQHCAVCQVFLENPLTPDGRDYVQDALDQNDGDPAVLARWSAFYRMEPCHCARNSIVDEETADRLRNPKGR